MRDISLIKNILVLILLTLNISLYSQFSIDEKVVELLNIEYLEAQGPILSFAAIELNQYLSQITGKHFSINPLDIPLFEEEILSLKDIQKNTAERKSIFLIKTDTKDDNAPFLIRINTNKIIISANGDIELLMAIYYFLEELCGCRWLSQYSEYIPSSQIIKLASGEIKPIPDFLQRSILARGSNDQIFSIKQRLNQNLCKNNHVSLINLINSPQSPLQMVPKAKIYQGSEIISLVDRQRLPLQLCYSNPALKPLLLTEINQLLNQYNEKGLSDEKVFLKGKENQLIELNLKGVPRIDLSLADRFEICNCNQCQKMGDQLGSHSAAPLLLINAIAKETPQCLFLFMAKWQTVTPPHSIQLADNIIIQYPLKNATVNKPLVDSILIKNKQIQQNIAGWKSLNPNLTINYPLEPENHILMHYPNFFTIQNNLIRFHQQDIRNIIFQGDSSQNAPLSELRAYIVSHQMWNTNISTKELIKEFCTLYYGKAAPKMMQFIYFCNNNSSYLDINVTTSSYPELHQAGYLSATLHRTYFNLLRQAQKSVLDSPVHLNRVNKEKLSILYSSIVLKHGTVKVQMQNKAEFRKIYNEIKYNKINKDNSDLEIFLSSY